MFIYSFPALGAAGWVYVHCSFSCTRTKKKSSERSRENCFGEVIHLFIWKGYFHRVSSFVYMLSLSSSSSSSFPFVLFHNFAHANCQSCLCHRLECFIQRAQLTWRRTAFPRLRRCPPKWRIIRSTTRRFFFLFLHGRRAVAVMAENN